MQPVYKISAGCCVWSQSCSRLIIFSKFLRRYVSFDESWNNHYTPKTKTSVETGEGVKSADEVIATAFWDASTISYDKWRLLWVRCWLIMPRNKKQTCTFGEERSALILVQLIDVSSTTFSGFGDIYSLSWNNNSPENNSLRPKTLSTHNNVNCNCFVNWSSSGLLLVTFVF